MTTAVLTAAASESATIECMGCGEIATAVVQMNAAQAQWSAWPVRERMRVLQRARHAMATQAESFARAISPKLRRTHADTLAAELMPLLDACRFLERETDRLLAPKKLGKQGRPVWLSGVLAEVHREPLGRVAVIGPSNFPLFLPGVQTLQALAAGNSVVWKPGVGGKMVAELMAAVLVGAGMPRRLLRVTDESVEAGELTLASLPDKVVFTGSSDNGRAVLRRLAETATPAVVEMSGADAVVVLDGADLHLVARAVAFGLRLNGGAVCMSPRRLLATTKTIRALRPLLTVELARVEPVHLEGKTAAQLEGMLDEAAAAGAEVHGLLDVEVQRPLLVEGAKPGMRIAQSDVFAPVISLLEVRSALEFPEMYAACPYALTAVIFCARGEEMKARALARTLRAGTVLINDLIVPTADPRVPFGGRGESGYGVSRGAEGLLEMTAVKVLLVRRGGSMRHLDATRESDAPLMAELVRAVHADGWSARLKAMSQVTRLGRKSG